MIILERRKEPIEKERLTNDTDNRNHRRVEFHFVLCLLTKHPNHRDQLHDSIPIDDGERSDGHEVHENYIIMHGEFHCGEEKKRLSNRFGDLWFSLQTTDPMNEIKTKIPSDEDQGEIKDKTDTKTLRIFSFGTSEVKWHEHLLERIRTDHE